MLSEPAEVQYARLDERIGMILKELEKSEESRKRQYELIERLSTGLTKVDNRVANVETQLATAQPTIQEFITIKHRVVGAGKLGKYLWLVAGALIGFIATSREAIFHWFSTGK